MCVGRAYSIHVPKFRTVRRSPSSLSPVCFGAEQLVSHCSGSAQVPYTSWAPHQHHAHRQMCLLCASSCHTRCRVLCLGCHSRLIFLRLRESSHERILRSRTRPCYLETKAYVRHLEQQHMLLCVSCPHPFGPQPCHAVGCLSRFPATLVLHGLHPG